MRQGSESMQMISCVRHDAAILEIKYLIKRDIIEQRWNIIILISNWYYNFRNIMDTMLLMNLYEFVHFLGIPMFEEYLFEFHISELFFVDGLGSLFFSVYEQY